MSIRRCSPYALGQPRALLPVLLACLLVMGCTSSAERREILRATDDTWRQQVPEDSHEEAIEHIRELADDDLPEGLASVPLLLDMVIRSPSSLVRAEALRAAWALAAPLPVEPPRPASLSLEEFQAATDELQALLDDPYTSDTAEAARLAGLLCTQRFPPEQIELAVRLADLACNRARWHDDDSTAAAFAEGGPGVVRHAASLVTLRASEDRADVVREEAYRAIRHLHPQLGLVLAADALDRELDGQRLLVILDGIEHHEAWISDQDWDPLLDLVPDVDLGVARRVETLRAAHR